MASRIEDYALIGDLEAAALVSREGSIDWLCIPRFDSDACFAALIGDERNGRWSLRPKGTIRRTRRRYRPDTLVLETTWETDEGEVRAIDAMPIGESHPSVVRVVEGIRGNVEMEMSLVVRFTFGAIPPWTHAIGDALTMTADGDALALYATTAVDHRGPDARSSFTLAARERVTFVLTWYPSHENPPLRSNAMQAIEATARWWNGYTAQCTYEGDYRDEVVRSLVTLKALTFAKSGASVAAVTASLPEKIGGSKNWDYRYVWVRDSTFTISAFLHGGFHGEALAWRDWVLRAVAGSPQKMQIMYGVQGARRIDEYVLDDLAGYEGSRPVRIGNAAYTQFQLGIYGETMSAMLLAHERGLPIDDIAWSMLGGLLQYVETVWERPDRGIWELRGDPQHFTLSKAMTWRAFDCAVRFCERFGFPGPVDRYRELRDRIHDDVCAKAFDRQRNTFVQAYGSHALDASVLLLPIFGFIDAKDERMRGTVGAIERELMHDGFVYRTSNDPETARTGGGPSEGAFLACNFWLVDVYLAMGREDDARALFERILAVRSDVGLLSEEYDPRAKRLLGNVPQTFSHAALVNSAVLLDRAASTRGSTRQTQHATTG